MRYATPISTTVLLTFFVGCLGLVGCESAQRRQPSVSGDPLRQFLATPGTPVTPVTPDTPRQLRPSHLDRRAQPAPQAPDVFADRLHQLVDDADMAGRRGIDRRDNVRTNVGATIALNPQGSSGRSYRSRSRRLLGLDPVVRERMVKEISSQVTKNVTVEVTKQLWAQMTGYLTTSVTDLIRRELANQTPARQAQPPLDRKELFERLMSEIRRSEEGDLDKALKLAALSAASDDTALATEDLGSLSPDQQARVQAFQKLLAELFTAIADDTLGNNEKTFLDHLDRLMGEQPINIRQIKLCRSVSGYGVYEPFQKSTFVRGSDEHPMIIYVELDHYKTVEGTSGRFRVELSQEVVLYTPDGTAVWRRPIEQIRDESRNRRRDFFVVQLIHLPANLSVGQYQLKVHITDKIGGTVDVKALPLQIVADTSLASSRP